MKASVAVETSSVEATALIHEHQDAVIGYLTVLLHDEDDAQDVFGRVVEDVLRGWQTFRHDCAPRTWLYTIARNAALRYVDRAWREREEPISEHPEVLELPEQRRTSTAPRYRSAKRKVDMLRAHLSEVDQTLLTLRLDRDMEWSDIAHVLTEGAKPSAAELARTAARLRKRFQRLKDELTELAKTFGFFDEAEAR